MLLDTTGFKFGGGGGNRTRVRKTYDSAFYIVIPSINLTWDCSTDKTAGRRSRKVSGCATGVALPYPVVNGAPVVPPASSLGTPVKPRGLQECNNCRQLMPCRFIKVGHLPRPDAYQTINPPSKPLHPHILCLPACVISYYAQEHS